MAGINQNKWISDHRAYPRSRVLLTSLTKGFGGWGGNSPNVQLTHFETRSGGGFPFSGSSSEANSRDFGRSGAGLSRCQEELYFESLFSDGSERLRPWGSAGRAEWPEPPPCAPSPARVPSLASSRPRRLRGFGAKTQWRGGAAEAIPGLRRGTWERPGWEET